MEFVQNESCSPNLIFELNAIDEIGASVDEDHLNHNPFAGLIK